MMQSLYFQRSEFACKCGCGYDTVDVELHQVLVRVRQFYDAAVTIISGCRCKKHNKKENGYPKSRHLTGQAADVRVKGVAPSKVQAQLRAWYPTQYGIGQGATFTHIDVRKRRADWGY